MPWWILVAAALASDTPAADGAPAPPDAPRVEATPATARDIAESTREAAKLLRSPRFAEREEGFRRLWQAGEDAEAMLQQLAADRQSEVAERARVLLDLHKFGLYPDTPPELARAIRQFRDGATDVRQQVLAELLKKRELVALGRLLALESDGASRATYVQQLESELDALLGELVVSRQESMIGPLLDILRESEVAMRHRTAWRVLRGGLEQEIARLRAIEQPDTHDLLQLLYHLRANGGGQELDELATRLGNTQLRMRLRMERRDWAALAADPPREFPGPDGSYVSLSFQATFERLAGRVEAANTTLDRLRELAKASVNPQERYWAFEALAINGRIDEGVRLLDHVNFRRQAVDLFSAQHRQAEALRFVGPGIDPQKCLELIEQAAREARTLNEKNEDQATKLMNFQVACVVARVCQSMGMVEVSTPGFAKLTETADAIKNHALDLYLCDALYVADLHEQAFAHAARSTSPHGLLGTFFRRGETAAEAQQWWALLGQPAVAAALPGEGDMNVRTFAMIDQLIAGRLPEPPWGEFETAVRRAPEPATHWELLAKTATRYRAAERARRYYELAAANDSQSAKLAIADLLAKEERWAEAAAAYRDCGQGPLETCLAGIALEQAGQAEQGRELRELALLLPFAGGRQEVIEGLRERGHEEEALRWLRTATRFSEPGSWNAYWIAQQTGNVISETDPAQAADLWELHMVSTMDAQVNFVEPVSYARLPYLIHRARAQGLLKANRAQEALAELELSREAMPGSIQLAEDFVPLLEQAGEQAGADALYAKMRDHLAQACQDFPHSSMHHNNLAWLAARCGRELDLALSHSERAVELSPHSAMYLDTLAEVQFRRGNRAEAIRLAEECVRLDPLGEHYPKQLARFREAP